MKSENIQDKLQAAFDKRSEALSEARNLENLATTENRDLTAEELQISERACAKFDEMTNEIARLQRLQDMEQAEERAISESMRTPTRPSLNQEVDNSEYRQAFEKYLRRGKESLNHREANLLIEMRTNTISGNSGADGGYTVPTEVYDSIWEKVGESTPLLNLVDVIRTSSDKNIPVESGIPTVTLTGEGSSDTVDTTTAFAQKALGAYKYSTILKVSEELLADSQFDLQGYVEKKMAQAFSEKIHNALTLGTGSSQPEGIVEGSAAGKTTAATGAFTYAELLDLMASVDSRYWNNCSFHLHQNVGKSLLLLVDGASQYIFRPASDGGFPDRIGSFPIYYNSNMDSTIDAASKIMVFGDIRNSVAAAVRNGVMMQRLVERYIDDGFVGFRGVLRFDSVVTHTDALKHLITAAS